MASDKKKKRKKGRKKIIVLEIIALLMLLAVVFVVSKFNKIGKSDYDSSKVVKNDDITDLSVKDYTTIALFGLDSRDSGNLGEGNHSDCIMVATINNSTKEVKIASIYRDSYVYLSPASSDGVEYGKATTAYLYGGPTQAVSMLNVNLDLDIDNWIAVDFTAVANTIDLLGGIDVEINEEEQILINGYATETSEITGIKTPDIEDIGLVHLDGLHATSYARIRYTDGSDYKRTERQREVIQKMIEAAKGTDLLTLNSIVDTVLPQVATDLSATDMLALAANVTKYTVGDTTGFPFEKTTDKISGSGDSVIILGIQENVRELHEFLYDDEDYNVSGTVSEIDSSISAITGYTRDDADTSAGVGANPVPSDGTEDTTQNDTADTTDNDTNSTSQTTDYSTDITGTTDYSDTSSDSESGYGTAYGY